MTMAELILDWIWILGALGAFLIFVWKVSAAIERKKNRLDENDRTIETQIKDLQKRIINLEEVNKKAATKRIAKSEDTGKLLQELLELLRELK
jgi:hypothetical protein